MTEQQTGSASTQTPTHLINFNMTPYTTDTATPKPNRVWISDGTSGMFMRASYSYLPDTDEMIIRGDVLQWRRKQLPEAPNGLPDDPHHE